MEGDRRRPHDDGGQHASELTAAESAEESRTETSRTENEPQSDEQNEF